MRLPLPISLSLLLFAAQKVCAQLAPADDFFHSGAQFYLSNNIAGAKQAVANGLKFYPDDDKLKKLDELLKQQNQSQSQQNQQSQAKQAQQKQDQKDGAGCRLRLIGVAAKAINFGGFAVAEKAAVVREKRF